MKNNIIAYLFLFSGIINIITSVFNFGDNRTALGIVYLCLSVVYILLGIVYRRKYKQENNKTDN